jgi:hypothetical protein
MAGGVEIKVEGADEVIQSLKGLGDDLEDIPTLEKVSDRYVAVLSALAPVRTGNLASSFRPSNKDGAAGAYSLAPYAGVVNYGSPKRGIKGAHFVQKADQILADDVLKLTEQGVDDLIDKKGLGQ